MIDPDSDDDGPLDEAAPEPAPTRPAWLKPLLAFAIALSCGLVVGLLWMGLRPHPQATLATPSGAAVPLDAGHRPLPAPMAGGTTSLPPPAAPAADAPHIVAKLPEEASPPESAASEVGVASAGAETLQGESQFLPAASVSGGDSEPVVVVRNPPQYPTDALRAGVEGTVHMAVSIDAQGNIIEVRVARSSGSSALDHAAMDAVRSWHYKPAMRGGQPAPGTVDVPVDFRLDGQ